MSQPPLDRVATPALVVGMKIPGGNPVFRQDKSEISPPDMGQAAVCCINEVNQRVLPVPLGGMIPSPSWCSQKGRGDCSPGGWNDSLPALFPAG